jgi:hypothetical protein
MCYWEAPRHAGSGSGVQGPYRALGSSFTTRGKTSSRKSLVGMILAGLDSSSNDAS